MSFGWLPWTRRHRFPWPHVAYNHLSRSPGNPTPGGSNPNEAPEVAEPSIQVPAGMDERAFTTPGHAVCIVGEVALEPVMPLVVTPGVTPIPHVSWRVRDYEYNYPFLLETSQEVPAGRLIDVSFAALVRVCGITEGMTQHGPRVRITAVEVVRE